MNVQVLISCMYQKDFSIVERTNIQSDVVVVNQCDEEKIEEYDFKNKVGEQCHVVFINTTERGLSRSRNKAMAHSKGDILLICDDDEMLDDNYVETILSAHEQHDQEDIIAFQLRGLNKSYPTSLKKVGFLSCSRISSVQISFKKRVYEKKVLFNPNMGSGTGNGAGEENKFLVDLLKRGCKMLFVPKYIGVVSTTGSRWFNGFNERYYKNRGWSSRQIYGWFISILDLFYTIFIRIRKYDKENSLVNIAKWLFCGYFEKR